MRFVNVHLGITPDNWIPEVGFQKSDARTAPGDTAAKPNELAPLLDAGSLMLGVA